ncbi:hypothetical protein KSD_03730 [Ktedonobacter sp. SOSP1-85]|uniref:type I restriction-modification system subunit M n=1 Tax=Ktedonobacter sp. SOSP1-85 TaxID=2778367 RepID=UPI0019159452|nr:class I SAM-dependent DNA methyltransferase [Ktedonobacter sp. SOSP1-85]GHO72602.1 hypothetical protein KSD_03730 [Ktedonobacter sp. SOSP1-85]
MNFVTHNAIVNFIWNIADDVLRDVYVRGKYRDVILPMTVLRRLDCLLEPTKDAVLAKYDSLETYGISQKAPALTTVSKYVFYNTSRFTFKRLLDEPSKVRANFEAYLNGFSDNVQVIIDKFKLRNQLQTLEESNRLYPLIQKFVSGDINLSPEPVKNGDVVIQEGLTNRGMGYVFEELIRRFNEENNEEAGEHFTPRDIIQLMANLIFLPIKDQIKSTTYLVYDDACGSGGMLTEAEEELKLLAGEANKSVVIELYGQEVNPETFAICQSDMLIKGRDPANIKFGSTLSHDYFRGMEFDFMLANPPYGKSWKVDQEALFDSKKKYITDSRYIVNALGNTNEQLSLMPRVSDGQLLFLVNMLSKMKHETPLGSRIAIVHNGSALFTGDAGQGESNIRRWILENDWLEAIISLPLDMFYNTGIATYIWVLSNRKPEHRRGKVQLIDASSEKYYRKLRKNLGKKNCELTPDTIQAITELFLNCEETEDSKIFDNEDFGYWKVTVERPLRLTTHVTSEKLMLFKTKTDPRLVDLAERLWTLLKNEPHHDWNAVCRMLETEAKQNFFPLKSRDLKVLRDAFTERDEEAEPVIERQLHGAIFYEADPELRDSENVPLKEDIEEYFEREVKPHVPDAWINHEKTLKGYEISFTKYFYKYQPLRSLEEITADILALENETEGLLHQIVADVEGAD